MEIKINREIREYSESIFFGLSLRQSFFAVLGVAAAIASYMLLKEQLGAELISWACVGSAAPFAFLAFFKYNGMTAEKFCIAWVTSMILIPRKLFFCAKNSYYEILQHKERPKPTRKKAKENAK